MLIGINRAAASGAQRCRPVLHTLTHTLLSLYSCILFIACCQLLYPLDFTTDERETLRCRTRILIPERCRLLLPPAWHTTQLKWLGAHWFPVATPQRAPAASNHAATCTQQLSVRKAGLLYSLSSDRYTSRHDHCTCTQHSHCAPTPYGYQFP